MNDHGLSTVVDDNDNVIDYKHWSEVKPSDRVRISSIWVENSNGDILMAQRSHHKKFMPNLWGPAAAGTVEQGETYESNAYKELEEEIGLSGVTLMHVSTKKWDGNENDNRFCACFRTICNWPIEKFTLQESEVDAVKWISKEQLMKELVESPEKYLPNAARWIKTFDLIEGL